MKKLFVSIAVLLLLAVPQLAAGAEVDDFKAEVEKFVQAFNAFDLATIAKNGSSGNGWLQHRFPIPQCISDLEYIS